MNSANQDSLRRPLALDPVVVGTACCILSALGYTAANICLRKLATEADKMWTICIKEVVTVSVIGPWLVIQAFRGRRVLPAPRLLVALVLTGLAVQLAGNLPMQWAFDVVGIAITIPAVFGVMLVCCAVFGLVFLGERVPGRSIAAIGLLIGSIALFSLGKIAAETSKGQETAEARASLADDTNAPSLEAVTARDAGRLSPMLWGLLGVAAACLTGVMFATLSTVIRFSATAQVPVTTIVFVVTGMGVLSLGSLSVGRLGIQGLVDTDPNQLAWMLAAGTFNLVAFLAITKGLQLTTVVHANVLNASQVAMGALAGVVIFRETFNAWVVFGICLTVVGTLLIGRPADESATVEGV